MENYYRYEDNLTFYPFVKYPKIFENNIKSLLVEEFKEFFELYKIESELISGILYHNLDFKNPDIDSFFYSLLFKDINKKDDLVYLNIKYLFTFDTSNCTEICKKTKINFGTIDLYKSPALYIIHYNFDKYRIMLNNLISKSQ